MIAGSIYRAKQSIIFAYVSSFAEPFDVRKTSSLL